MDDQDANTHPAQLEPDLEITPDAQYISMTTMVNQLAATLLKENTPEQLASIAAQHLIYVDSLNNRIQSMSSAYSLAEETNRTLREHLQLAQIELRTKLSVRETAKYARLVLDMKHKQRARAAALASHKEDHAGMAVALADWDSIGAKYSSRRAFARERHKLYSATDSETVYRWLLKNRPLSNTKTSEKTKQTQGFHPKKT